MHFGVLFYILIGIYISLAAASPRDFLAASIPCLIIATICLEKVHPVMLTLVIVNTLCVRMSLLTLEDLEMTEWFLWCSILSCLGLAPWTWLALALAVFEFSLLLSIQPVDPWLQVP